MTDLQQIMQEYGEWYSKSYHLSKEKYRAIHSTMNCRTEKCGWRVEQCENCNNLDYSYNSCGNRNCTKCQHLAREKWINNQKSNMLNIPYFHTVFTIPSELNRLLYQNQKQGYDLLFKAASETLVEIGADEKYLGAELGFTMVLHTWSQNLSLHPHLHALIAGGGMRDGKWIACKKNYLFPVKVLSKIFRGKFLEGVKNRKWKYYEDSKEVDIPDNWGEIMDICYKKDWVVYTKETVQGGTNVIEYLGRYTFKTAISNSRIIDMDKENQTITFSWKDYSDHDTKKRMTLDAYEFIRRILLHVLPSKFIRVRHYGFLGNRNKKAKLEILKELVGISVLLYVPQTIAQLVNKMTGKEIHKCSKCNGATKFIKILRPHPS